MKIIKFNIEEAELSASFIFCRKFSFVPLIHIVSIANQCCKQYNLLDEYNGKEAYMKKHLLNVPSANDENEQLSDGFFLKRNVIKLWGQVCDEMANYAVSSLLYLDYLFKAKNIPRSEREINIWINSPGGSVTAGMAIYDTMNYIDSDIRTTCVGMAASMGAFLLSAGTKGKREALPNSEVMIHQPLGGTQGQASDILLYAEQIRGTRDRLNTLLALHTGKPIEQIRIDTDRDNRMSAQAACEYGLIDRVIQTPIKASIITLEEFYEISNCN